MQQTKLIFDSNFIIYYWLNQKEQTLENFDKIFLLNF